MLVDQKVIVERSVFEGVWLAGVGLDPSSVSVEVGAESEELLDAAALLDVLGEDDSVSPGLVCESVELTLVLVDVEDVDEEVVSASDPVCEVE
jgi:hypothetical protein